MHIPQGGGTHNAGLDCNVQVALAEYLPFVTAVGENLVDGDKLCVPRCILGFCHLVAALADYEPCVNNHTTYWHLLIIQRVERDI